MNYDDFLNSLEDDQPPAGVGPLLEAMWHDGNNDWDAAHMRSQDVETPNGSWVHGYLHLKEGDQSNAKFWYNKAGKQMPTGSLQSEWSVIVTELLKN